MNFKRSLKRPHVRPSSNNKEVADLLAVARFPIHGTKPHSSHNSNLNKPLTIPLATSSLNSPTSSSISSSTR